MNPFDPSAPLTVADILAAAPANRTAMRIAQDGDLTVIECGTVTVLVTTRFVSYVADADFTEDDMHRATDAAALWPHDDDLTECIDLTDGTNREVVVFARRLRVSR